tara:strand:- start:987 stop:1865 length:879 start_codon:yes stop_codon:yes gene_type:complete
MSKNILVIGGAGFIGSHTSDELTARGHKVKILDQVESLWLKDSQEMIIGDYLDKKLLNKSMQDIDIVYNFAGIADIGEASDLRQDTIKTNIIGASMAIEAMINNNVKRLVYSSSMYVYSDKGSFYRASKQAAEILIESYSEKFDIDYTILRYGSLYGSRSQNWNGIKKFIIEILNENKVNYSGSGEEVREYINVIDAAKLSVDVLNNDFINKAVIITGQQSLKVKDLFKIIFEILGKKENVIYEHKIQINDHYGSTPYRFSPKTAKKIVPYEFTDLGQGLLDLIEETHKEKE